MTGETGYVADCNAFYKDLKRQNFTPMDLYSWDTLVLLEKMTRSARRIGEKRDNLTVFRAFRNQIFQALRHKAEDIEATTGDSEPMEWLEELKSDIRAQR